MKESKNLQEIYDEIKKLLSKYEPEMKVLSDYGSRYELAAKGEYEVTSERTGKTTTKKDPYFAGIIIQSSYVGFYNTAVYMDKSKFEKEDYWDGFSKNLKGKSCFHIKVIDDEVSEILRKILAESYSMYERKGWL